MVRFYKKAAPLLLMLLFISAFAWAVYNDQVTAFGALVATIGGSVAVTSYTRSVSIARLEWLLALFHRYMDESRFRRIRYIIVFRVSPEYELLKDLMEHRGDRKVDRPPEEFARSLILDMDDYLNFFELIATLWSKGELTTTEIRMLYHDYIRYLWQMEFTHRYITTWGFEALTRLATSLFGPGPLIDSAPTPRAQVPRYTAPSAPRPLAKA
jgi:hypothetical protein